uniref:BTB domain-containing protein n=1 Tax=Caenorhabditis tropicalis TaxID=1561998 RepID=A0A1I7T2P9_9PELO
MIRQEPKLHFLYHNVDLDSFCKPEPVCQELDFAAFEDIHAKSALRINKNADLEIRLRRDGPPDPWMARGLMTILVFNDAFESEGSYPVNFCSDKPYHITDLMSRKSLLSEFGDELFNVDISIKFDKWENLKVQKLFQFDHKYLDSDLFLCVQGHNFFVRSKTIFREIPALQKYLEQNFDASTTCKYELKELGGEKSVPAFCTMLQVAYRCTFITNIHEVGEVLSLAFRFDFSLLKQKCEYYLINEPESEWMQKLVFADLYDLKHLRAHVLSNTIGLAQIYKDLHLNRFLKTKTIRSIMLKACDLKKQKMYEDAPPSWAPLSLPEITENRWQRMKRLPLAVNAHEPDISTSLERFDTTIMPKHFGVELITPEFSFAEKTMNFFSYKVQLGPDNRMLFKLDWNNVQTGNFVWTVDTSIFLRMQYQFDQRWEYQERVQFNCDHPTIFFDGPSIQKLFPGGVEHLLDGLGLYPNLPKIEVTIVMETVRGLDISEGMNEENVEEMDDEWILQPARTHPIVCCGKYIYVDKEVLRSKSRTFSKVFEQTYEPITIPLANTKFDSFSSFLDILHGDEIFLDLENAFLIVEHARSFRVQDVLDRAVDFILEEAGPSKIEKLELAIKYKVPEIQKAITDSIVDVDELFEYLKIPNQSRRMCQILLDRMTMLPIPEE